MENKLIPSTSIENHSDVNRAFNFSAIVTESDFQKNLTAYENLSAGRLDIDRFEDLTILLQNTGVNGQASENDFAQKTRQLKQQLSQKPENVDLELFNEVSSGTLVAFNNFLLNSGRGSLVREVSQQENITSLKNQQDMLFMEKLIEPSISKANITKGRKNRYKMTQKSREFSEKAFASLVERTDGDLLKVKHIINEYSKHTKVGKVKRQNSDFDNQRSVFLASLRGKTVFQAYENFVAVELTKKAADRSRGIKSLFGGKKASKRIISDVEEMKTVQDIMTGWSKLKSKDKFSNINVWEKTQEYGVVRETAEHFLQTRTMELDNHSRRLLSEIGIKPTKMKSLQNVVLDAIPPKWRQQAVLFGTAIAGVFGGRGLVKEVSLARQQEEVYALTQTFVDEWNETSHGSEIAKTKEAPTSKTIPTSKATEESGSEIELKGEALEVFEDYYKEVVLPNRLKHLDKLSEEERMRYLEAIGGPENLDNGLFVMMIMGKDTDTGERYGLDKDGFPLGRNDQNIALIMDTKNNKVVVVSVPRDIALPGGMYGRSTPGTVNGLTWVDQVHMTEDGGYVSLDRKIAHLMFTEALGVYVDGMLELDFYAAASAVDQLFPNGIEIVMSDSFVPENEVLGRISGYRKGGYRPFEEGKAYTFDGEAVVALLRARETRQGDTYQREANASSVMMRIAKQIGQQMLSVNSFTELTEKVDSVTSLLTQIDNLEDQGHIRTNFWGEEASSKEILGKALESASIEKIWELAKAYRLGRDVLPEIEFYNASSEEMEPARWYEHKVVFPGGNSKKDPHGQERDPLKFWGYLRDKVKNLL